MAGIIAVHSMKGGVGKSSLAVNLAHAAAAGGARVLLWDLDAQGAAAFLLGEQPHAGKKAGAKRGAKGSGAKGDWAGQTGARGIFSKDVEAAALITPTHYDGLDLIAGDLTLRALDAALEGDKPKRLRKLLGDLQANYDYILLDCPPGLGALSDQIFRAADLVVVPLVPAPLSLRTLAQVEGHLRAEHGGKGPTLLPVFSMVDGRKTLHRTMVAAHVAWPGIPQASVVEQMAVRQMPLAAFAPNSNAARCFAIVWARVKAALG